MERFPHLLDRNRHFDRRWRRPPPIVLLAFADVDPARPINQVGPEEQAIQDALEPVVAKHRLLRPVSLWQATPDRIVDEFRRESQRGRICIFHFGGHASPTDVLFAHIQAGSTKVSSKQLADYLGHQEGLSLVFLNGCLTEGHREHLRKAGIKAVISTTRDVGDTIAARFAKGFYEELRSRPLAGAFKAATAASSLVTGDTPRELPVADSSPSDPPQGLPWRIDYFDPSMTAWQLVPRPHAMTTGILIVIVVSTAALIAWFVHSLLSPDFAWPQTLRYVVKSEAINNNGKSEQVERIISDIVPEQKYATDATLPKFEADFSSELRITFPSRESEFRLRIITGLEPFTCDFKYSSRADHIVLLKDGWTNNDQSVTCRTTQGSQ